MAASSASLHEPAEKLAPETIDRHRAIVSLMEELEAVDWYDQRLEAANDEELRAILAHNRDEEKEHASMALEWLRRHDAKWDEHLKTYLFTAGPILEIEQNQEAGTTAGAAPRNTASGGAGDGSLGIGSLRGEVAQP
jgi:ferritin-like protein